MKEDIQNFPKQLRFSPKLENEERWGTFQNYVLLGMGGSHLQGDVFRAISPDFPLSLHKNYGLPRRTEKEKTGFIAASYSGNTEEVLDAYGKALEEGLSVAVISKGGELLRDAKERGLPYIELPEDKIEPRMAIGYSYKSLLCLLKAEKEVGEAENAVEELQKKSEMEEEAKEITRFLEKKIPIVYASERNCALAAMWKINFNETAKIPSFYNVLPELNHNEMAGFDKTGSTKGLSEKMRFLFLKDEEDHPRNRKRMDVLKEIWKEKGFQTTELQVGGSSRTERVFANILLSEWTAYFLAKLYGVNYENSELIEKFKERIK